jgi:nitrite reductase (NO-forming)/hydroxylamine reductase
MRRNTLKHLSCAAAFSALPLLVGAVNAAEEQTTTGHPKTTPGELRYMGPPVAVTPEEAKEAPKAPPMTPEEMERAKQIYFERCAGWMGCCAKVPRASP